jgi:hypothetical protein
MKENLPGISLVIAMIALGSSLVTLVKSKEQDASFSIPSGTENTGWETQIASLQRDLQQQRSDLESFRQAFRTLMESGALSARSKFVVLDPASKAFGRVDTENGFFLVSCQDVRPYLDGHKVTLHIGNPLGVRFVGFKITARWGPRYAGAENDYESYAKWMAGLKARDFSFPDALEPGRWNEVELVLTQTGPRHVGYIQLSLDTNTVAMFLPRK